MATLAAVMAELKSKGNEKTHTTYVRHGAPAEAVMGVSIADLKTMAKTLKREQALAYELYDTGKMEAMYLAGLIASGTPMTRAQLQGWAEGTKGITMISDHTVPWVTVENAEGRSLAMEWIGAKKEHVAAAGWCSYSGLVTVMSDEALDMKEVRKLLQTVVGGVHTAPNHVRSTMNRFVIAVGSYVVPLAEEAKAAARAMGVVTVDVGDTACKVPDAIEYIAKVGARAGAGAKKKTIRC